MTNDAAAEKQDRVRNALRIALSTFSILALELSLIRWMSQQVRMFAYLNNVLLISAFLGMGLGLGIGRKRPNLIHFTLPVLVLLAMLLSFSAELGLMRLSFPDPSIYTWGNDPRNVTFLASLLKILLLIGLVVVLFVCAASLLGFVFGRYGDTLGAYSWDLIGSLLGVLTMTALAALNTTPPVWFCMAALPLLWLSPRPGSWLAFVLVVTLAALSVRGARFSPYNRLDLVRDRGQPLAPLLLAANRDAHQYLLDLSREGAQSPRLNDRERAVLWHRDYMYRLPFVITPNKRSALIVGAGTGNDVAAALRNGFKRVVAVEIDPVIFRTGRELHPEKPYSDPRVEVVISDARTYFERHGGERFDVVCFGLLDSHAMFSAMSSLRLDNYVYTLQSMRSAWKQLAEHGVLSVTFSVAGGQWVSERLASLLREATGIEPVVISLQEQFMSRTFLVVKDYDLAAAASSLPYVVMGEPKMFAPRITTDDWPFLYLRPGSFPFGYLTVLTCLLAFAAIGARAVYGESFYTWQRFSGPFFFMGAAFLLIETRGVTNLSLLFGSTWIVNSAVFAGILLAALAANLLVARMRWTNPTPLFLALGIALLINYFILPGSFLRFSPGVGGTLAAIVNGVPVGIAGIIFSLFLSRSSDPAAALGWNLLGAVLGGCLEYFSLAFGLRALTLIAMLLYAAAYLSLTLRRLPADPIGVERVSSL